MRRASEMLEEGNILAELPAACEGEFIHARRKSDAQELSGTRVPDLRGFPE